MEKRLKVRQPLSKVEVLLADTQHQSWLEEHDSLLRDELNVKQVEYTENTEQYVRYLVQPNFKRLGPRVGKLMPAVKKALGEAHGAALLEQLTEAGKVTLDVSGQTVDLDAQDIQVRLEAKEGWAAAQGRDCVVVLATELTEQLIREGLARDLVRHIQERRKAIDCQYTDRIEVGIVTESAEVNRAVDENRAHIESETLAQSLAGVAIDQVEPSVHQIADSQVEIYVRVMNP
jgi:isoleucyl-tRNA synthetase